MTDRDLADADWARALLNKIVRRALLRIAFEFARLAREVRP